MHSRPSNSERHWLETPYPLTHHYNCKPISIKPQLIAFQSQLSVLLQSKMVLNLWLVVHPLDLVLKYVRTEANIVTSMSRIIFFSWVLSSVSFDMCFLNKNIKLIRLSLAILDVRLAVCHLLSSQPTHVIVSYSYVLCMNVQVAHSENTLRLVRYVHWLSNTHEDSYLASVTSSVHPECMKVVI